MVAEGTLPHLRLGNGQRPRIRFRRTDILFWMKCQARNSAVEQYSPCDY
ncbi:MAG: hypothetical protein ABIM74_03185 [candidate division WOR-3 bacterium]